LELDASHAKTIAVLATVGTCNTGAYPKTITSTMGTAGKQVPMVIQQGFAELAAAIEGDANYLAKSSVRDYVRRDVRKLVEDYKRAGGEKPIGYVVLGCTHFPLVREEFLNAFSNLKAETHEGQALYSDLIADAIEIVNPAELTAKELFRTLARERLRAGSRTNDALTPLHQFFMSVPHVACEGVQVASDGGFTNEYKYGRDVGQLDREDYRVVPLTKGILPGTSKSLIESRLPRVWAEMSE
jgi:glutamate racemase